MIAASLAELIRMAPQASALPAVHHGCRDMLEGRPLRRRPAWHVSFQPRPACAAHPGNGKRALEPDAAPIHTISRAINLLGMQRIHDLVLASCLAETLEPLVSVSKLRYFWRHSLRMALGRGPRRARWTCAIPSGRLSRACWRMSDCC